MQLTLPYRLMLIHKFFNPFFAPAVRKIKKHFFVEVRILLGIRAAFSEIFLLYIASTQYFQSVSSNLFNTKAHYCTVKCKANSI